VTSVPEELAEYFAEYGPGPAKFTDSWQGPAYALAQMAREFDDAEAGSPAVALMQRIVAASSSDDPERGHYLANLAMAGKSWPG
jgi:hypothetical protein